MFMVIASRSHSPPSRIASTIAALTQRRLPPDADRLVPPPLTAARLCARSPAVRESPCTPACTGDLAGESDLAQDGALRAARGRRPRPSPPCARTGGTARGSTGRAPAPCRPRCRLPRGAGSSASAETERRPPTPPERPSPSSARDVGVAHDRGRAERGGLEHRHALRLEADRGLHDRIGGRDAPESLGVRQPAGEDDGCRRPAASRRSGARPRSCPPPPMTSTSASMPRLGERLEERQQPLLGAHAAEPDEPRPPGCAHGRAGCERRHPARRRRSRSTRRSPADRRPGTTPCSSRRRAKCDDGAVTASERPANRRRYDQPSRPAGLDGPPEPRSARRCHAFSTRSTSRGNGAVASMPTSTRLCIVCTTGRPCRAANRCPMNAPQKSACTCTTSTGGPLARARRRRTDRCGRPAR